LPESWAEARIALLRLVPYSWEKFIRKIKQMHVSTRNDNLVAEPVASFVSVPATIETDVAAAVRGTCDGDEYATDKLFALLSRGLRWYILRQTNRDDAEDILHMVWIDLVTVLRRGQLRDPRAALAYARHIAIGHCADWVKKRVQTREKHIHIGWSFDVAGEDPDVYSATRKREQRNVMARAITSLKPLDRQILERFYLNEQDAETVQRELGLTATQFRLRKSRAKQKLAQIISQVEHRHKTSKIALCSNFRTAAYKLTA
jgi:RNA polymerase sigma factor (sigma-70 family)